MSAAEILRKHGVTRLCHFTKLKNLIHILTENDGILATDRIEFDIKSINDMARYDVVYEQDRRKLCDFRSAF